MTPEPVVDTKNRYIDVLYTGQNNDTTIIA